MLLARPSLDLTAERFAVQDAHTDYRRRAVLREAKARRERWINAVADSRVEKLLRAEVTMTAARKLALLRRVADDVAGRPVLIWGGGVGTYVYPFADYDCHTVIAVAHGAASEVAAMRLSIDAIDHTILALDDPPPLGPFAAVVALDVARYEEAAQRELLTELLSRLAEGGTFVTTFRGATARQAGLARQQLLRAGMTPVPLVEHTRATKPPLVYRRAG